MRLLVFLFLLLSISDELLGVDQSREGIHEHTITELNGVYYLMCGLIASTFSQLERVLKSTDMIHWELATKETPWNEFDYLKLNNIRPVAYNNQLVVLVNSGVLKVADTGILHVDYRPDKQFVFTSTDGINWMIAHEVNPWLTAPPQNNKYLDKPRPLIINGKLNFYGSMVKKLEDQVLDDTVHILQLSNTSTSANSLKDESLVVYPNPVQDIINVKNAEEYSLEVYDLTGVLCYSQKNIASKLDLSRLKEGIYILVFIDSEKVIVRKIRKC